MKRLSDELGKNARYILRFIDGLKKRNAGDLNNGVQIENGIVVRVFVDTQPGEKTSFPLPPDRSNNRILLVAHKLRERGGHVVIVSKDFVVRVKAEAIGLEAEDYENLKFSYDNIYRGYRRLEVAKRDVDLFFKDGFLAMEDVDLLPNEYCLLTSPEMSSAVGKFNPETKRLEPLMKFAKDIWGIQPLNVEQKCALDLWLRIS